MSVLILSVKTSRCMKPLFCKVSLYAGIDLSNSSASHDKLEMCSMIPVESCLILLDGWLDLMLI